jgi:hypothetical protein
LVPVAGLVVLEVSRECGPPLVSLLLIVPGAVKVWVVTLSWAALPVRS